MFLFLFSTIAFSLTFLCPFLLESVFNTPSVLNHPTHHGLQLHLFLTSSISFKLYHLYYFMSLLGCGHFFRIEDEMA